MNIPLQITFHDVDHSEAVAEKIRKRVFKLERLFERIISCRVVVESPHRQHAKGNVFNVRVDVSVPGAEIVINGADADHSHEDVYVAVRDAFDVTERRLEEHARKLRERS